MYKTNNKHLITLLSFTKPVIKCLEGIQVIQILETLIIKISNSIHSNKTSKI